MSDAIIRSGSIVAMRTDSGNVHLDTVHRGWGLGLVDQVGHATIQRADVIDAAIVLVMALAKWSSAQSPHVEAALASLQKYRSGEG